MSKKETFRTLNNLIAKHKPCIVFLMETKQAKAKLEMMKTWFEFPYSFYVDLVGRAGGLALWLILEVKLTTMLVSKNYIDSSMLINGEPPYRKGKAEIWEFLTNVRSNDFDPWCILSDSNIVCSQEEKIGGNSHDSNRAAPF
ncbi:hypothetical protein V6N11_073405 [Hibiscus sabdariffa]|uniref:Uncharacterized protein n=2 Tax=Hibiscus sabdariffa TaxID=183260 RepID=A0ABR2AYR0_9ROSI